MKIAIIGTRGIPAKYGGFETFAQELSVRLVKMGVEVDVYCDNTTEKLDNYNGVRLHYISCTKSDNPFKYYRESIIKAEKSDCEIILMCGAGGAIMMFEKFFGSKKKYFINTDGVEHKRTKWSYIGRKGAKLLEFCAMKFSDFLIADSYGIKKYIENNYSKYYGKVFQIEYGASIVNNFNNVHLLDFGLTNQSYYLIVSRLEPENNVSMIIEGYLESKVEKPLIIVGNILNTPYVESLLKYKSEKVRFLGGVYNKSKLESLRQGAYAYLHGHSVGGTNPSLLEAMGCGNIVVAHDNIYNREVTDNKMMYFKTSYECASSIRKLEEFSEEQRSCLSNISISRIRDYYNWERITDEYYLAFEKSLIVNK